MNRSWVLSLAVLCLAAPAIGLRADPPGAMAEETILESVTVTARRLSHSGQAAPRLVYDLAFFQRFEPVSVGDMLRRVPGVVFSADLGEHGPPQLRGLAGQYTTVLVNGGAVPGSGSDRSVDVDRIPAELVERIEIIRSPTPALGSDGIAGTVNIVLKDGSGPAGVSWRVAALDYPDAGGRVRGAGTLSVAGARGDLNYYLAASMQEQRVPKEKVNRVFDRSGELLQVEPSLDERDSTDYSASGTLQFQPAPGRTLRLTAAANRNDAAERENLRVLDATGDLEETRREREDLDERRSELRLSHVWQAARGPKLSLALLASRLHDETAVLEAVDEGEGEAIDLLEQRDDRGSIAKLEGNVTWPREGDENDEGLELGLSYARETRKARQRLLEREDDELVDVTPGNGRFQVEETRLSAYLQDARRLTERTRLEYGLRMERTELEQRGELGTATDSYLELTPSAHLAWEAGHGLFRLSLARTVRRPEFDQIIPFAARDTPGEDQVTLGNPGLEPETAWGLDLGHERRLPAGGVFGVNLFYRDIDDLIELEKIAPDRFRPANVGTGQAWGIELDGTTSLAGLGLPGMTLSATYSLLDSSLDDPLTGERRRFNLQPRYVANLDLIHAFPTTGWRYGLSFQKRGSSGERLLDERSRLAYEGSLELFVEKTLARRLTLRLTAENALDARRREETLLFEGLNELQAGEFAERQLEIEQASPIIKLTLRGEF